MRHARQTGPVTLDRAEIPRRLDHAAGIAAVRGSLIAYSAGKVQQPPVVHMGFAAANGDCHVKCARAVAAGLVEPKRIGEIGASLAAGSLTREPGAISIAGLTGLGAEDAAIAGSVLAGAGPVATP